VTPFELDLTSIKRKARRGTKVTPSESNLTSIKRKARRG